MDYDFSTGASQAFGNNQLLRGSKYCIFNGDVNQDAVIDLSDIVPVYNDAGNFVTGYKVTDTNGDNITDLSDVLIANNNSVGFVTLVRP